MDGAALLPMLLLLTSPLARDPGLAQGLWHFLALSNSCPNLPERISSQLLQSVVCTWCKLLAYNLGLCWGFLQRGAWGVWLLRHRLCAFFKNNLLIVSGRAPEVQGRNTSHKRDPRIQVHVAITHASLPAMNKPRLSGDHICAASYIPAVLVLRMSTQHCTAQLRQGGLLYTVQVSES